MSINCQGNVHSPYFSSAGLYPLMLSNLLNTKFTAPNVILGVVQTVLTYTEKKKQIFYLFLKYAILKVLRSRFSQDDSMFNKR